VGADANELIEVSAGASRKLSDREFGPVKPLTGRLYKVGDILDRRAKPEFGEQALHCEGKYHNPGGSAIEHEWG